MRIKLGELKKLINEAVVTTTGGEEDDDGGDHLALKIASGLVSDVIDGLSASMNGPASKRLVRFAVQDVLAKFGVQCDNRTAPALNALIGEVSNELSRRLPDDEKFASHTRRIMMARLVSAVETFLKAKSTKDKSSVPALGADNQRIVARAQEMITFAHQLRDAGVSIRFYTGAQGPGKSTPWHEKSGFAVDEFSKKFGINDMETAARCLWDSYKADGVISLDNVMTKMIEPSKVPSGVRAAACMSLGIPVR